MRVYVLILTFNNYADTKECIHSLESLDYDDHEIIIIDNAKKAKQEQTA